MACPTCDHTMQKIIGPETHPAISDTYWCPRCGTIKLGGDVEAPKLVERCRTFIAEVGDDKKHCRGFFPVDMKQEWQRLGIAEAIDTPANRQ